MFHVKLLKMGKKHPKPKRHSFGRILLGLLLVLATAALLAGTVNARIVRVEYRTAHLDGLDSRLEGLRILYISDLKISNTRKAVQAANLIKRLCASKPDIVLIGGDICGLSLWDEAGRSLGFGNEESISRRLGEAQAQFLLEMNDLFIRGGIYAVTGDCDPGLSWEEERRSNIRFLKNEVCAVSINGAYLPIYGCAYSAAQGGYVFSFENTGSGPMIVLSHDPGVYKQVSLAASHRSHNPQEYILLAGHGLGGQVRVGSRYLAHPDTNEKFLNSEDFSGGVYKDGTGLRMLPGQGIGSELFPFRLGTRPTAYYIQLSGK